MPSSKIESTARLILDVKSKSFTEIVLHLELRRSPQIPSTVIQTGVSPSFAQSAVLVRNVPYFLDASLIEDIFIKILDVSRKSVCVFVNDCDLLRREYFAVFDSKKHAETLINKVRNLDGVQLESFQMGGSKFYCQQYQKQFEENPAKVRKDISEWLREFTISEQRQKKSALLKNGGELKTGTGAAVEVTGVASVVNVGDDGGGWQVVTCHGKKHKEKGVAFTHANQKKSILLERRKSEQKRMMNFYKQHINSKKDRHIAELRQKFERDRLIVSRMKNESRKFNPSA